MWKWIFGYWLIISVRYASLYKLTPRNLTISLLIYNISYPATNICLPCKQLWKVCWTSSQSDQNLRGPHVARQQQYCHRSISAARAGPQQQTRRPPLLLSIDGTDRRTDTLAAYCRQRNEHNVRLTTLKWHYFAALLTRSSAAADKPRATLYVSRNLVYNCRNKLYHRSTANGIYNPPKPLPMCALNIFFGRVNELQIYHGNFLLMDNKHRKSFVIKQSKGCTANLCLKCTKMRLAAELCPDPLRSPRPSSRDGVYF